jgi:hypothetical protein
MQKVHLIANRSTLRPHQILRVETSELIISHVELPKLARRPCSAENNLAGDTIQRKDATAFYQGKISDIAFRKNVARNYVLLQDAVD